jgi:hypothetical protein
MSNLSQDLEMLRELNENRRVAKERREQALRPLKRDLSQDLEMLRELSEGRRRAKELREQTLQALKQIEHKNKKCGTSKRNESPFKDRKTIKNGGIDFGRWVAADDEVEIALLVKVQSHREISENENENNKPRNASPSLKAVLENVDLAKLLQQPGEASPGSTFPVLLAARGMQALVNRRDGFQASHDVLLLPHYP